MGEVDQAEAVAGDLQAHGMGHPVQLVQIAARLIGVQHAQRFGHDPHGKARHFRQAIPLVRVDFHLGRLALDLRIHAGGGRRGTACGQQAEHQGVNMKAVSHPGGNNRLR